MANIADEEKALLDSKPISNVDEESPSSGDSKAVFSTSNDPGIEENGPWPATFERSISLLAGPQTDVASIDRMTRSPRIIPIQAAKARKKLKNIGRGFRTPDPANTRFSGGTPDSPQLFPPLKKTHSLDYSQSFTSTKTSAASDRLIQQKLRLTEASSYRQKILQNAAISAAEKSSSKASKYGSTTDVHHSPGYDREKASDKHKMEQKAQELNKEVSGKTTFWQCVFNMSNILLGVGMLGLPYIFKNAGWFGGFLVTFGFASMAWRTSILIGRELNGDPRPCYKFDDVAYKSPTPPRSTESARMRKPLKSFPDIARESFGQTGAIIVAFALYFELFSCLSIFFVSIGDHLHALLPNISNERHMLYTALVLIVPTAVLRTPRLLSYLSLVGTISTICVVLVVFYSFVTEGDISDEVEEMYNTTENEVLINEPTHILWDASGLPLALGLIAYTFSGHAIVPSVYTSMEKPQQFEKMIHVTFIIVLSCCLLVAVSGYYMFGSMVEDQITISLEVASKNPKWAMDILTMLMILTAFSKFVLSSYPLTLGTEEIIAPYLRTEKAMERASSLIKIIYIALSLLVAIYVPSFSFMCSLVGLICTMIVSVIFPAGAHIILFGSKLSMGDILLDWFYVIGGTCATIIGTIATIK